MKKLNFDVALVAYSEIALKSEPVRRMLERLLIGQIGSALRLQRVPFQKIHRSRGRIYVSSQKPFEAAAIAAQVFGVQYTAPTIQVPAIIEDIERAAVRVAERTLTNGQSFAVRARRVGGHPFTSRDLEVKIGDVILKKFGKKLGLTVNLKKPGRVIYIDARELNAYIYTEVFRGVGGLPFGSQGKIVAVFTGDIYSALATWLMMKRGTHPLILIPEAPAHWGNKEMEAALQLARSLRRYVPYRNFAVETIPFDSIIDAVGKANRDLSFALQQRFVLQMACEVAKVEGAMGLVIGATFGRSASRALKRLSILTQASRFPLFHPLIGLQNVDVQKLAKELRLPEVYSADFLAFHSLGDHKEIKGSKVEYLEGKIELTSKIREALHSRTAVKV